MLRRQQHRTFRKPLIHFFSKKLLRHPLTVSNTSEIVGQTSFTSVLDDQSIVKPETVKKLVFCAGQVWVDIYDQRQKRGLDQDVAIVRIEQLAPLHYGRLIEAVKK
jgi:2-oxoglutarate dehydrogenase E1 component